MKLSHSLLAFVLLFAVAAPALESPDTQRPSSQQPASFDQLIDRVIQTEARFNQSVRQYSPTIETYIQNLRPDRDMGMAPRSDEYFLGRLDLKQPARKDVSMLPEQGILHRMATALPRQFQLTFSPLGFGEMIFVDPRGLDRANYDFALYQREFLGDLRCFVIDVKPKVKTGQGRFLGRIWVEDQGYNIVRFTGMFTPRTKRDAYFLHFDSWRLNMQPGLWLPAYTYVEESDRSYGFYRTMHFKAQTRFWGYDLHNPTKQDELTSLTIESVDPVHDQTGPGEDLTPVEAKRAWDRMAEDNVLSRLQQAGLLAPEGDVDKVLRTVINNLELTNNIAVEPQIRARVLLTTPFESFTVGNTIVISRGLLDVLPDEATLAAVLAHELAHITLGHRFDSKYAFADRVMFPDEATLRRFEFHQDPTSEKDADERALTYLQNSPYKDKLSTAGLFLQSLRSRQSELKNLIRAHMGNPIAQGKELRMSGLMTGSPKLEARKIDQIASLPLGGRIQVDPWSNRIELYKKSLTPLISPKEKMPFEVTPVYPYLSRYESRGPQKVAGGELGQNKQ